MKQPGRKEVNKAQYSTAPDNIRQQNITQRHQVHILRGVLSSDERDYSSRGKIESDCRLVGLP